MVFNGNEEELLMALESSSHNIIASNDARGCFDHMCFYLPRFRTGEEIYDG